MRIRTTGTIMCTHPWQRTTLHITTRYFPFELLFGTQYYTLYTTNHQPAPTQNTLEYYNIVSLTQGKALEYIPKSKLNQLKLTTAQIHKIKFYFIFTPLHLIFLYTIYNRYNQKLYFFLFVLYVISYLFPSNVLARVIRTI